MNCAFHCIECFPRRGGIFRIPFLRAGSFRRFRRALLSISGITFVLVSFDSPIAEVSSLVSCFSFLSVRSVRKPLASLAWVCLDCGQRDTLHSRAPSGRYTYIFPFGIVYIYPRTPALPSQLLARRGGARGTRTSSPGRGALSATAWLA